MARAPRDSDLGQQVQRRSKHENGIDAEKRKQQQFFALAERFRNEQNPDAANRLGDELGRMVFGG